MRSSTRIQMKNYQPGEELFPEKGSSYVPSGLTKEQYEKMKKEEQAAQKNMNFAMWGPKFQQSDRPNGDWMVQPSLWTGGFNANKSNKNSQLNDQVEKNDGSKVDKNLSLLQWLDFAKRHTPAFFAVYAISQFLEYAIVLAVSFMTTTKATPIVSFKLAALTSTARCMTKMIYGNWKFLILKLFTASFFACPFEIFVMERLNRKRLWSRKRSFFTLAGIGALGLISWCGALSAITRILPSLRGAFT